MDFGKLSRYRRELMGVCTLGIIAFHNFFTWPKKLALLRILFSYGNIGVDGFLILSGIGLYYAYSRGSDLEPAQKRRTFYWKRFVRLAVPYLMIMAPYYLWKNRAKGAGGFLMDFFQLSLPLRGMTTSWYVTASAIFYLLFPLIYRLQETEFSVKGRRVERGTVTLLMCVLAAGLVRLVQLASPPVYKNCEILLSRIVVFILGCSLGKAVKEGKEIPDTAVLACFLAIPICIYGIFQEMKVVLFWRRMLYVGLGLAWVIDFAYIFTRLDRFEKLRGVFAYLGDRSLELYLTHVVLRNVWLRTIGKGALDKWDVLSYACVVLGSILLSCLLHPVIERISKRLLALYPREAG